MHVNYFSEATSKLLNTNKYVYLLFQYAYLLFLLEHYSVANNGNNSTVVPCSPPGPTETKTRSESRSPLCKLSKSIRFTQTPTISITNASVTPISLGTAVWPINEETPRDDQKPPSYTNTRPSSLTNQATAIAPLNSGSVLRDYTCEFRFRLSS